MTGVSRPAAVGLLLALTLTGCAVAGSPAGDVSSAPSAAGAGDLAGQVLGPSASPSVAVRPTTTSPVPAVTAAPPATVTAPGGTTPPASPAPSRPVLDAGPDPVATPAPSWLGTRVLGPAGSGPVAPQRTPPELLDRRIVTVDVLPAPVDGQFTSSVADVPADVLARSTWEPACPVAVADLRYVLVAFWGFDGRPHTGELLLHRDAVDAVVAGFAAMHDARFPLEEVRVVAAAELDAAPTGDGNVTSAFVCRPTTGGVGWSEHAYGRAIDINPFHNPYDRGTGDDRVVIPELATAYTDRDRELPGMLHDDSAVVRELRQQGWTWGGDYRTLADWQHFSADGG